MENFRHFINFRFGHFKSPPPPAPGTGPYHAFVDTTLYTARLPSHGLGVTTVLFSSETAMQF